MPSGLIFTTADENAEPRLRLQTSPVESDLIRSLSVAPPRRFPMRGSVVRMKSRNPASPAMRGNRPAPFPIVGIGASAGGLEAFSELLRQLPLKTGMAFVLVQHLDPKHSSELREILARTTKIPVAEVTDGTVVRPDHIYVIPPNTVMAIKGGVLRLSARVLTHGQHLPIDHFLRSLAEESADRAISVILSGSLRRNHIRSGRAICQVRRHAAERSQYRLR